MSKKRSDGRRTLLFTAILTLIFIETSCVNKSPERRFDSEVFKIDKYNLILCFDLRDDEIAAAGLMIQGNPTQTLPLSAGEEKVESGGTRGQQAVTQHLIVLPFETTSVQNDRDLLLTSGSYKDFTVINYLTSSRNELTRGVGISPVFGNAPNPFPQVEDLRDNVYLLRSGLERRFIYRYQSDSDVQRFPTELRSVSRDVIDAIGIATPPTSKGIEIRNNLTAIPSYVAANNVAKFYPANLEMANARYLEVRYAVEANAASKLFVEIGLKVLAANLIPLLELFFLGAAEISRPKVRKIVMWGGALIQLIVLAVLIWIAVSIRGELTEKTIIEGTNILVGAIFTALVLFIKRTPNKAVSTNP